MDKNPYLSDVDLALMREAAISASSIAQGLTMIRKYDYSRNGFAYQGFFATTIGIERLLKLIYIYDYRIDNENRFPGNIELRDFGHRIDKLYSMALEVAQRRGHYHYFQKLEEDDLFKKVLLFLSDFASMTRYYNLDLITDGLKTDQKGLGDPLARWNSDINSEIVKRHYKPNAKNIELYKELGDKMSEFYLVNTTDESGKSINTPAQMLIESLKVEVKQKYSMFYLYSIARSLSYLFYRIDFNFPVISEYFEIFRYPNDKDVLNKKVWDIYKP